MALECVDATVVVLWVWGCMGVVVDGGQAATSRPATVRAQQREERGEALIEGGQSARVHIIT